MYNPSYEYTFINNLVRCDVCTATITGEIPDMIVITCGYHQGSDLDDIRRILGKLEFDNPYKDLDRGIPLDVTNIDSISILIELSSNINWMSIEDIYNSPVKREIIESLQGLIDQLEST
jgi:hypothetical protein